MCYIYQGVELDNQFYKTKRTTFGYLVTSPASLRSSRVAPKEAQEPEEVEQVEEQQEPTGPVSKLDGHKKRSIAIEDGASLASRSFSRSQNCLNAAESDHLRLFGVNCDNKVTLRNPSYEGCEDIELPQFDPNFMSTEVVCRFPSGNNINLAAAKCGKRDLYLCSHHHQVLRNKISVVLAKEPVQSSSSLEEPELGQFAGYTSLISVLDGPYSDAKKLQTLQVLQSKSLMVQEAILNVRNFLIITSTVLVMIMAT